MALFRRREPLHERLAREGGLVPAAPPPHDTSPRYGSAGVHGVPRAREWDVVAIAEAQGVPGDSVHFTALPDGTLLVDDDLEDGALEPLAEAVEKTIPPPYRAEAVRRAAGWAVGARRIRVLELPPHVHGESLELVAQEGQRQLTVDETVEFGTIPALEVAAGGLESYVVRASRLDGDFWEIVVDPL